MKFTIKQFTGKGLSTIGTTEGSWKDLAIEAVRIFSLDSPKDKYPLATAIEVTMENAASDNDYSKEEIAAQDWNDELDNLADSVMHCNAPFIYNGNGKQITKFHADVYATIEVIAKAQCKAYFDKEEYVQPTFGKKAKRTNKSTAKTKANVAGVYPSPTKSEPGRWVAYYRSNMQTIKLGFYSTQEEAEQAKLDLLKPSTK